MTRPACDSLGEKLVVWTLLNMGLSVPTYSGYTFVFSCSRRGASRRALQALMGLGRLTTQACLGLSSKGAVRECSRKRRTEGV